MSKRSYQRGTIEKHGSNWRGKVYVDVVGSPDRQAKWVVIGTTSMTKREAQRKFGQMVEEMGINSPTYQIPSETPAQTFTEISERWEDKVLNGKKPKTQTTMKCELRKHLRPAFGSLPVEETTTGQRMGSEVVPNGAEREIDKESRNHAEPNPQARGTRLLSSQIGS